MQAAVEKSGRVFALTHNYTGYPLVRADARNGRKAGELGEIRLVQVEYPQDWLTGPTETTGNKQAEWRVDPARSGAGGALGDIGTHAYNLADFVTGIEVDGALRRPHLVRRGAQARRQRADHAALRQRRARRAVGEPGRAGQRERPARCASTARRRGLDWVQANPNQMLCSPLGESTRIVTRGGPGSGAAAARVTRVPPGHPEGYLEGFANIYSRGRAGDQSRARGRQAAAGGRDFPTIDDGVKGLAFIEAAVKSSKANGAWTPLQDGD